MVFDRGGLHQYGVSNRQARATTSLPQYATAGLRDCADAGKKRDRRWSKELTSTDAVCCMQCIQDIDSYIGKVCSPLVQGMGSLFRVERMYSVETRRSAAHDQREEGQCPQERRSGGS